MLHRYFLLLLLFCATIFSSYAQSWKTYPYHQPGSVLDFPADEGYHPGEIVEWWYTNAHVTGDSTGTNYSLMLTYFYYPVAIFQGFRIFELSNENTGTFVTETAPCNYPTLAQDHLHIMANTGLTGSGHEEWNTRDSSGVMIPFEYTLNASMPNGSLNLTYKSKKRPLMVGGTGFLYEGITGYTYYYSETELEVTGTVTMNGVTEHVHGISWIDRQWGQFNPNNGEQYTWMSLQLSNGQDMNLWNIFNTASQIPDTSTYQFCTQHNTDTSDAVINDFTLERLKFTYTADAQRCYDQKWRLTYGNTDLILSATHSNNEVTLPFRFFEGSMLIEGTVDGAPVTGVGYVELLHSFSKPNVNFTSPVGYVNWDGSTPVTWHLKNPDDGRPVYYDLDISTDNKATFTNIANHLTDTSFNWTPTLSLGAEGWFRIKAYSIDTTLANTKIADTSFVFGATAVVELNHEVLVSVFPNPFSSSFAISYNLKKSGYVQFDILNAEGQVVKNISKGFLQAGKQETVLDGAKLPTGIYFYRLNADGVISTGKVLKDK